MRTTELTFLEKAIAEGLLSVSNLEVAGIKNVSIGNEIGREYIKLRMLPTQARVNRGNRAELSINFPYEIGDKVIYEWDMRIPKYSQTDAPLNRWWILGQWHDQPDVNQGENWNGFPDRSPTIALGYGVKDGRDVLSLSYGAPDLKPIDIMPIKRNQWYHIRAVIEWAANDTGSILVFVDNMDTPFANATGRNMHNAYQHYIKLGMYRHPEIQITSEIHIDNVRIRNGN